ncbi:MAG: AraC family transcriptional regulator [Ignavibacteriae bacterium]|nr:AraC family transcriptional regulator [Ignavibacteriota bacterium]
MNKNFLYRDHIIPETYRDFFVRLWEFSIKDDLTEKRWGFNSFHLPYLYISRIKGEISVVLNGSSAPRKDSPSYGGTLLYVFELKPYLLNPVFGVSAKDILKLSLPVDDLKNSLIDKKTILSLMCGSFERTVEKFGNMLNNIGPKPDDKIIYNAINDFIAVKGKIKPGEYTSHLSISERQFQRRFKNETGMSAMSFLKNLKLSCLSHELLKNDFKDNGLVFDFGYFDLPHYIKDFKDFHGCSPLTYRDRVRVVNLVLP